MPQKIEISYKTIGFTVILLIILWFLYNIRAILLQLLVAFIVMTSLNSTVNNVEQGKILGFKMSRLAAILVTYITALLVLIGFIVLISQPLYSQTVSLFQQLPYLVNQSSSLGIDSTLITEQLGQLGALSGNIFRLLGALFTNLFSVVTTLVMSFYLLLEREQLHKHLVNWFANPRIEKQVETFIDTVEQQMGGWIRAQLLLMLIIGLMSYIGFLLLKVPYALPLALIAGLLEIIPNIGPIIATVPAVVAGFSVTPIQGVGVLIWAFVVQQLENHLIVPQLMRRSAGVNPLVTIISLLIGYSLAGVTGAILAVPMIIIARSFLQVFVLPPVSQE